jgi:hypothetical protein
VAVTLDPTTGRSDTRQSDFDAIRDRLEGDGDAVQEHMIRLMDSFRAGLFAGGDELASVQDNLELERWFRVAKGHERRIHGHRHVGARVVQEGATPVPALDAHRGHPEPFGVDDLLLYRSAREPECQRRAIHRRGVMRKARSKTRRPKLLEELERRYLAAF